MTSKIFLVLAVALTFGACPQRSGNTNTSPVGTSSTGGFPVSLDQTFPDTRVLAPQPPITVDCPPGSFDLKMQTLSAPSPSATGTLTIDAVGPTVELASGETKLTIRVPDGTKYSASLQFLSPRCKEFGPARPISATFGFSYRAVTEDPNPNQTFTCVFRSRSDYTSFSLNVTGTPLDGAIQALLDGKIKDELLKKMDFQVADQMNRRTGNTPLPTDSDPRCEWKELSPDGTVNR